MTIPAITSSEKAFMPGVSSTKATASLRIRDEKKVQEVSQKTLTDQERVESRGEKRRWSYDSEQQQEESHHDKRKCVEERPAPRASHSSHESHSSRQSRCHFLPMSGVIYLENIKSGIKTHEGRVCRGVCQSMRVGDRLILQDRRAKRAIECEISSTDRYTSFRDMLAENGVLNMLPQLREFAKRASPEELLKEGVRVYESFPGARDVSRLGAIAIGVRFIKDV